jgi:cyclic beta-1,2-glucan synthetase
LTGNKVPSAWQDTAPIRSDLFGTERLEHHAETLAAAQIVSAAPTRVPLLSRRLRDNVGVLLDAYRASAAVVQGGQTVTPAAEWLLDNFHLVELQLREITEDLPPGYYRQLPKLATGHLAGYPRVFGLAWAYVAHTDSLIAGPILRRFVQAYQRVTPLMIGELWAVAISLRIVLVENMRRLAVQIIEAQDLRTAADALVDRVTGSTDIAVPLHIAVADYDAAPLPEIFAAQIARRLRGFDPVDTPLHGWLEDRLRRQGTQVDDVVARALHRQGASNVTMRNIVTSMRIISELDWATFFEDVSLVDARLRASSDFGAMDFATRNSYRTAIENLSRGCAHDELAVTDHALAMAAAGTTPRERDPGFGLVGRGRPALERELNYRLTWRGVAFRVAARWGLRSYLGAMAAVAGLILWAALWVSGAGGWTLLPLALLGIWPATDAATALVNHIITRTVAPHPLPGMLLPGGVPDDLRTLVAVPVLLTDQDDLLEQIERLEVHHLCSVGGAVHYALLSDGPDAPSEVTPLDASLIARATQAIAELNNRYSMHGGERFHFLHRRRLWNPSEGCWMGWERKRGKLHELNRLLRGAADTSFLPGPPVPQDIRYVITLDADTRLPRDTVRALIGKMAHPMNRARFDDGLQRVTEGYGILQPRVTPALPVGAEGSIYQRVYSSPGGIEPYAAAISDVYQDLFGEGSFTGKGIYDVDAFTAALDGRVPDNTMLSHDLFEGVFARAGLASDIEVIEDFPARFDVAAKRQHRWVRGDWQLLPWVTSRAVPVVGRWKMLDNLRRSLVSPFSFFALLAGWLMPLPAALVWTSCILAMLALPRLLNLPHAVLPKRLGLSLRAHFLALAQDAGIAIAQIVLNIVFLADQTWLMLDAILRTLTRLFVRRRHLLEWVTAAQAGASGRPGMIGSYLGMIGGTGLGIGSMTLTLWLNPALWPLVLPFSLVWALAPAVAHQISRPHQPPVMADLAPADVQALRQIARRTWRYFEAFVTEGDNFLPPDNFQETPRPVVAHRTSPTNIGLYLLSTVTARDMGWLTEGDALQRLEQTLATMDRMPRFRGHFYNWYDTTDLRVLDPAYVSSVDSGNLAGHLLAVAQSCRDWVATGPANGQMVAGLRDMAALARLELDQVTEPTPQFAACSMALSALHKALSAQEPVGLLTLANDLNHAAIGVANTELTFWTAAILHWKASRRPTRTGRRGLLPSRKPPTVSPWTWTLAFCSIPKRNSCPSAFRSR